MAAMPASISRALRGPARRANATAIAAVAALALAAAAPAPGVATAAAQAPPAEPPPTVLQDDAVILHSDDDGVRQAMAQLKSLGVDYVRVTAGWSVLAPSPDSPTPPPGFDATDPAQYPTLIWRNLDRAVRDAHDAGLKVDIDIAFWAPRWATQEPASASERLRADINPAMYAQFAAAVAKRYSGSYTPPAPAVPVVATPGSQPPAPPPSSGNGASPDTNAVDQLLGLGSPKPATTRQASDMPQPATAKPDAASQLPNPAGPQGQSQGPLPAADMFTIWNEPNQEGFLTPQWTRVGNSWVVSSADIYRAMVQAAYPAIKAQAPSASILVGGTSSMGSNHAGRGSSAPLAFLRQLACVDVRLRPITTGSCADFKPLPGDGWAHHPYSLLWLPNWVPHNPDMAPIGATFRLTSLLRRLAQMGRISAADENVYMTEYGYGTNPPDPMARFSLIGQQANDAWAENIALQNPAVKMWPQFLLRDRPDGPAGPQMRLFGDWHTGLFFNDGTPKPIASTFRVPTFAQCIGVHRQRYAMVWGRLRDPAGAATSALQVSSDGTSWQAARAAVSPSAHAATASIARTSDGVITRYVRAAPHLRVRLVWTDASGTTYTGASTIPQPCARPAKRARATRHRHHH